MTGPAEWPVKPMTSEGVRPAEWLKWGAEELGFLGEREARSECELLLETLAGISRLELHLEEKVSPSLFPQFAARIEARKQRIPLAYLLGKAAFWEDEFEVEEGVLIPRPDTEALIESFICHGGFSRESRFRFLDLGTGSGNIAVTLAKLFPRAEAVASDISWTALQVAGRNAKRLGVGERIRFLRSDGLLSFKEEQFDVILSNPPYVAQGDWDELEPEIGKEPRLALAGGEDGLDFYHKICREKVSLKTGGSLWVEVGRGQAAMISPLFQKTGFRSTEIYRDLNQIERVVAGTGHRG